MVSPIRPGTTHVVGCVSDSRPLLGKWETLTGEGGLGVQGVDVDMVGGDRDQGVRLIVKV